MKPRLLDLFCGAGGAGEGYRRAGFEVHGVDEARQPEYPFKFHQADALLILQDLIAGNLWTTFDAVHASPPCPAHSNMSKSWNGDPGSHPDLIPEVRDLLKASRLPYVIENVVGAPLINPIQLCGSSFALGVEKHRLFECSFPAMAPACAHGQQEEKYDVYEHGRWFKSRVARVYGTGGGKAREHWPEAMGIDWITDDRRLKDAIPPRYTAHIGVFLMAALQREAAA